MNIFVGNLSHSTVEDGLRKSFEQFGEVAQVNIIKDKYSGEPKGFGFVEMPSKENADAAIAGLNGQSLDGRTLNVSEAKPREEKSSGNRRYGSGNSGGGNRRSW